MRTMRAVSFVMLPCYFRIKLTLFRQRRSPGSASHRQRMPCPPALGLTFPASCGCGKSTSHGQEGPACATERPGRGQDTDSGLILHRRGERPGDSADGCGRVSQNCAHPRPRRGAFGEGGGGCSRHLALRRPVQGRGCHVREAGR